MGRAKELLIKIIPAGVANEFIKRHHYSGKVVNNTQVNFGVFMDGVLHGCAQLGPSLDKNKIRNTVKNTGWNEFIEINRLAFDDYLPKNSESRALSIIMKMLRKNAPHIKWVISFADATQCGDGTIYRAAGFQLIGIKKNNRLIKMPDGYITHGINLTRRGSCNDSRKYNPLQLSEREAVKVNGGKYLPGFQLKYIYFLDKSVMKDLTVPSIPFSKIKEVGASMYKGVSSVAVSTPSFHEGSGGSIPTLTHEKIDGVDT